jgi:hypothetical protein
MLRSALKSGSAPVSRARNRISVVPSMPALRHSWPQPISLRPSSLPQRHSEPWLPSSRGPQQVRVHDPAMTLASFGADGRDLLPHPADGARDE